MKPILLILVVILHLSLVLLILRMDGGDAKSVRTTAQATEDMMPSELPDLEATREKQSSSATAQRFDRILFRRRLSPLPTDLARKTDSCRTGVLLDWDTREILWQKDENKAVPIASLTKMMTTLLLMESLRTSPQLELDTVIRVTPEAYKVGGSQVYLDPRESFTVDELLKCVAIFSANDAAYLLAQFLGQGDADHFVQRMNQRSREMGLDSLKFYNPHGLPVSGPEENRGNALQLAFLAGQLLQYPEVVKWSSTWISYIREDTDNRFQLVNRNRLVQSCPGVNGMKTGFIQKAGFCLAATCERDGRRLIAVVTGCPSAAVRNDLVTALLEWGYEGE